MLSDEVVRQLSDGDGLTFLFDFSKISGEFYEPLLRTLQHFSQKKVESIGFSCDSLAKAEQKALTGQRLPVIVLNSIAKNKSHYVSNIIELLCHILPRSTRIKEITLSNMNIRKDYLTRLISTLSKSSSLEKINFINIHIGDDLFHAMLSTLNPNQIKSVKINHCGITSKSTNDIITFIQRKTKTFDNTGIQSFQISTAEIPENDQLLISRAFGLSPRQFASTSPSQIVRNFPKVSPKVTPNNTPLISPKLSSISANSRKSATSDRKETRQKNELAQIRAYEKENTQLRKELAELRNSLDAVQYNENVFIVGKGSEEFVKFILDIETKIKNLEKQKAANGGFF